MILGWEAGGDDGRWSAAKMGGPALFSIWGKGDARVAVGCTGFKGNADNDGSQVAGMHRVQGMWVEMPLPADARADCFSKVWFEDERNVLVSGTKDLLHLFDARASAWVSRIPLNDDRCRGMGGGELWCPSNLNGLYRGDGNSLVRGDGGTWFQFGFGAESGTNWGNVFRLDDDVWFYGDGILHCQRSPFSECVKARFPSG